MNKVIGSLAVILFTTNALGRTEYRFLPDNVAEESQVLHFGAYGGGVTEREFRVALENFKKVFEGDLTKRGLKLIINSDWENTTINAVIYQKNDEVHMTIYGGLARHKYMTPDALSLVACHELGHFVGGAPVMSPYRMSVEGQSDYYATLKCSRRLFREYYEGPSSDTDVLTVAACENAHGKSLESDICKRAIEASKRLSFLLADVSKQVLPSIDTPDTTIVEKTSTKHPRAQCRLDTYVQGALCTVDYRDEVSLSDPKIGTCNIETGHNFGNRPACWYKN